ncbi:epimerase, partial [Candidatus Marinamargulisbacteria bacterium SCGC AAA071-K20]
KVCNEGALPLIVIRPRTILGEGRLGIFQILFKWIQEGVNIYIIGKGEHLFQFVHAHDLIDAYMLAMDRKQFGIYNVGTDSFKTLAEDLEDLIAFAKSKSKLRRLPEKLSIFALTVLDFLKLSPLAPWHYLTYHKAFHFDVTPLKELGWKPKYSNTQLFEESYSQFLETDLELKKEGSPHRRILDEKILWLMKKLP